MLVVRGCSAEPPSLCNQVCISSLASHLRWCARFNGVQEGMAAHHHIIKHDLHRNTFLSNLLLHFYGECGALDAAHALFGLYPHDVFSYNFMIAALLHSKEHSEALHLFYRMHHEAILPDNVTYAAIFSTLASIEAGRFLHACILHCLQVSVATAIMHMYGRCGSLHEAQLTFQHMHAPDVVAWNCILGVHANHYSTQEALVLYGQMKFEGVAPDKVTFICLLSACDSMSDLHVGEELHFDIICRGFDADVVVGNALVSLYAKFSCVGSAEVVFESMPEHSVASWNTIIGVLSQSDERVKALNFFNRMQQEGVKPNKVTFLNVIPACHPKDASNFFDTMNEGDVVLWNGLLSSLRTHKQYGHAIQHFCRMQMEGVIPNESTYNIILSVCSSELNLSLGKQVHVLATSALEDISSVGNALITMYESCSSLVYARSMFMSLLDRTVILWTIMLTMLTHHNECAEAVQMFERMLLEGVLPDRFVFASILDACASFASLTMGKCIHARVLGTKSNGEAVMGTALLNMYAVCGCLRDAESVFKWISEHNTICHNAMIVALAHHGQAHSALGLFERTCRNTDSKTFVGLLTACSHCGLIEEGIHYFDSMQTIYELQSTDEHHDCIIDLLGRAGQVREAVLVIKALHVKPTALTYRTLLSACCKSGDVIWGCRAASQAYVLEPDDEGCYFMLLNVCRTESLQG